MDQISKATIIELKKLIKEILNHESDDKKAKQKLKEAKEKELLIKNYKFDKDLLKYNIDYLDELDEEFLEKHHFKILQKNIDELIKRFCDSLN
jgi:hydroxymethylpyrimidine/phosphomethylpyrimidine kinase